MLCLAAVLGLTPTTVRRTIPFPKSVLAKVLADPDKAVPGTRVESPPFMDDNGCSWQVLLYPFGGNADPNFSGRVGVYLKSLDAERETDATFCVRLKVLPGGSMTESAEDGDGDDDTVRGLSFRCGMTFCPASEAGESVGRCEDWGAHVYATDLLIAELQDVEDCLAAVEVEIDVWAQRPCKRGASLKALADQVRRLPEGSMRVGEVVVALPGGGTSLSAPSVPDFDGALYRPVAGVEYRVMRLTTADGADVFDTTDSMPRTAYLLPTSRAAREAGRFDTNEDALRQKYARGDSEFVGLTPAQQSVPNVPPPRQEASGGATEVTWGAGTRWPAAVPIASLPPLASRLGFRALPARLAYTAATNARVLLLLIAIGASPLWAGYGLSQLGSFYAIPSASMEATLRIGDVVFAEKASRWLARDTLEVGDLVLFRAPPGLQKLVAEAGGRPIGSRDLFVKRVAAVAGDVVELLDDGGVAVNGKPRTLPPNACSDDIGNGAGAGTAGIRRPRTVPEDEVFVLGDCPARSTDSRSWGTLPLDNVVARPVVRVWPLDRRGDIS